MRVKTELTHRFEHLRSFTVVCPSRLFEETAAGDWILPEPVSALDSAVTLQVPVLQEQDLLGQA
jgi:hypothetical protein